MLKTSGYITTASINMGDFKRQFHKEMVDNLKAATKAWLSAATGKVPVWSGMALASLFEVYATIGGGLVITPRSGVKSRVAQGMSLGSAQVEHGPDIYSILIKTSVKHYVLQEEQDVGISPSAPWQSFPAGIAAASAVTPAVSGPKLKIKRTSF